MKGLGLLQSLSLQCVHHPHNVSSMVSEDFYCQLVLSPSDMTLSLALWCDKVILTQLVHFLPQACVTTGVSLFLAFSGDKARKCTCVHTHAHTHTQFLSYNTLGSHTDVANSHSGLQGLTKPKDLTPESPFSHAPTPNTP